MQALARRAAAAAGLAAAALVHAQGADELWQITSRMEMEGMQMPPMSQQVCMKKGETQAEGLGQQDPNCKVTEQRRTGNKFTWKVECTGANAMTGTGEMTRNRDTLEGRMQMKSKEGDMKIAYSGKLTGACNARTHEDPQQAAMKKQMAAMQAQGNAEIARVCQEGMEKFSTDMFERQGMPCVDRKGAYCAHVKKTAQSMRTHGGYRAAMQKEGLGRGGWERAGQFCQVAVEPVRASACQSGMGARDWDFVAEHCPAETKKLAGEHCAGRDYTSAMSSEYKPICAKYTGGFAQPQRAAAKPAAPSAADAVKEGTRALKNLFGR
jgi:hypothetical protein